MRSLVRRPSLMASSIMRIAGRSLTEPPGFMNSSLTYTSTPGAERATFSSRIKGVLPTASRTDDRRRERVKRMLIGEPCLGLECCGLAQWRARRRRPCGACPRDGTARCARRVGGTDWAGWTAVQHPLDADTRIRSSCRLRRAPRELQQIALLGLRARLH